MILRFLLCSALLAFQVCAVLYARFVPSRYFCWAPFDMQTEYQAEVSVGGRKLSAKEIQQRYRRGQKGVDNRSVQHVIDIFQQTEERYHRADRPVKVRSCRGHRGVVDKGAGQTGNAIEIPVPRRRRAALGRLRWPLHGCRRRGPPLKRRPDYHRPPCR